MEPDKILLLVAALVIPPLLLLLALVIAAVVVKRRIERRAAAAGEAVLERTRRKLLEKGMDPQAVETRLQELAATTGARIQVLAEKRGVDLEEAKDLFFNSTNNLAVWLDSKFKLPFGLSFGLDFLIGLVPVAGGMSTALASSLVVLNALQYGIPVGLVVRMAFNVALDYVVGFVPALGNVIDIFFRANNRNMKLLGDYLDERKRLGSGGP